MFEFDFKFTEIFSLEKIDYRFSVKVCVMFILTANMNKFTEI